MAVFRTAKTDDMPYLRTLWQQCFGDSDAFCDWFFSERWLPELSTVAEEDGQILSAVHGWPYTLRIRNNAIPSIIMCGVATHPAARGKGLMGGCLSLFMQSARAQGFLALFQKPVDFEIYRRYLHFPAADAAILTAKNEAVFTPVENMLDSLCSDVFAEELLSIYQKNTAGYSACVIRSIEDMGLKLRDYAADGGRLLRYAPNGYTAAYAAYYITDDQLLVPEIMGNDAHAALLMEHLAAMAQGRKLTIKTFRGPVPDGFTAEISPWGAMAALNAPALMREVCGFDDISVEITDPIIPENNGIFTFSGAVAPSAHIKLDAGRLTQLLVGYQDILSLIKSGYAEVLSPEALLLGERLPALPCFTVEEY
ncbi:MAG: GNAT family N-acetyltransferase [Christensenellales bacterium]